MGHADSQISQPATPPPADLFDNPMGTDGFEFVEYTAADPAGIAGVLELMGFTAVARHRSKNVTLYRQGQINFILNGEPDSNAAARPGAWRLGERHGLPRQGCGLRASAHSNGAEGVEASSGRWS
jgi:4-hydroxyphenylpyruvate dioxygenase